MIKSSLLHNPGVSHGFFTRNGGCSTGLYSSLNCGPGSEDARDNVTQNRQTILARLTSQPAKLCGLYQIHSNRVHYLDQPWDDGNMPQGDAVVTREKNIALGILTADCAPVLLADAKNGVIGAAHAGWKGALDGILENIVQMMCREGAELSRITAAVGPCIARENYEVGPEFLEKFADQQGFFTKQPDKDRHMFDLKGFVISRLHHAGLHKIDLLPHDTYHDANNFFSYRRTTHAGEKDYGRQISAIMLL